MKTMIRLGALLSFGLFAAACIGPTDDGGPADDEVVSEAEQPLPSSYTVTTYYREAAKINYAGSCISPSICTGSTTTCTGQKTIYYERETNSCL
ncbi:Hypothetical protein A7982_08124 [Minicystis rosea]|nr:Hypothetical protein A7982_08124 [Minicystis rosea]